MPRKYFDQKLADLNRSMKEMGAVVDRRIGETMEALKNLDKDLAAEVVGGDREINQVEHEIESVCMNLLALQQPIATDLRVIASCLKIITDVERVADQCADICDITGGRNSAQSSVVNHVVQMLETAGAMFEKAMDAFIAGTWSLPDRSAAWMTRWTPCSARSCWRSAAPSPRILRA